MEENMTRKIGQLIYDPNPIGTGCFGTFVYRGSYTSIYVAVKRVIRTYGDDESTILVEIENMQKAGDHPNILKYIHHEMDNNFIYIATELCRGTLDDYFNTKYDGPKFTSVKEILLQVTRGLAHLHEKGIVHRDIKPTNILIFVSEVSGSDPVIKLADFGISKALSPGKEDYTNTGKTNPKGTRGWMAPEVYQSKRFDSKVDIFQLGLIFAYTLSKGNKHPFGDDDDLRIASIKKMESMTLVQQDLKEPYSDDNIAFELIKSMLNMKPDGRPAVGKIVNSTFFNSQKIKRLDDLIESLRDIDLSKNARAAIRREDLKWLCQHMRNNLFQVLPLMLAENGADVNDRDDNGMTPILRLCHSYEMNDLCKILELLINKGADVKVFYKENWFNKGRTALHLLAEYYKHDNLKDIFDLLINAGVPVEVEDHYIGKTLLHLLAEYYKHDNLKDIFDLLIKKGVPVDAKNYIKQTVLHCLAKYYKHDNMKEIIDLLIKNGVPVDARNEDEETVLHNLAEYYKYENMKNIIDILIEAGVPVNAKDKLGNTALHLLARYYERGNLGDIVKLLKAKGARLDVQSDNGLTPLMMLCGNRGILKHVGVFSLLTPNASKDPLRSVTQLVIHLLEEFDKKKIGARKLEDELEKIHWNVKKEWKKQ